MLRLSFYGSIGCGVILICVLVNYTRTPRWISMVLWGLVALRLVVPLSVSSSISLLQLGNTGFPSQLERALSADHTYSGNYKTAREGSHEYDRAVAAGSPIAANANGNKMTYYYERANGGIEPAKTSYERFLTLKLPHMAGRNDSPMALGAALLPAAKIPAALLHAAVQRDIRD